MPELSQANLAYRNARQTRSDEVTVKQTMKRFHEENDPRRMFFVIGYSAHQHSAQAKDGMTNKVHTGMSVIRW